MPKQYLGIFTGPPTHLKPRQQVRGLGTGAPFLLQIQHSIAVTVAKAGKTIGDEPKARPTLQFFAPFIRQVPIHMMEKFVCRLFAQYRLNLPRTPCRRLHVPLGRQTGVNQAKCVFRM